MTGEGDREGDGKRKKQTIPLYFHFLVLYSVMHRQYPYSQEDQHYKHTDALSPPCISYPEIKKKKTKNKLVFSNIFRFEIKMII